MKSHWILTLCGSIIILVGTGCGGINANGSVSPLSFFLPGIVQASPKIEKVEKPISQTPLISSSELAQAI